METQRLLLYLALGFLSLVIYQTWLQDYHTPVPVQQTSTDVPGAPQSIGAPAVSSAPGNAVDLPNAVAGSVATPLASETAVVHPSVSVKTDVMDILISARGATIVGVQLLDYSVSIEDDTPFTLVSDDPLRLG